MGRHDWYRNEDWDPAIEAAFFAKLKRARDKAQYLRIQASILAESRPETALMLLEHYFSTGDSFDRAQALVDQATAHVALGDIERALTAYGLALEHERKHPNVLTQAYVELPFLIAVMGQELWYEHAIGVLNANRSRPVFPVERFKWHAANALIREAMGDREAASQYARLALKDADDQHSGFRYHPSIGLVGPNHADLRKSLSELVQAKVGHGHDAAEVQ